MEEDIQKIKISALPEALTVSDSDCFLIVQNRKAKRAKPSLMKGKKGDQGLSAYLGVTATHIVWKLGIDGTWQSLISIASLIGPRGEKPIFKKVNGSLMMKYEGEPETAYVSIFDREELKMKFTDLTAAEVDLLKLHFSDLTEADKAELMKPAVDAAARADEKLAHISAEVNQTREKLITDADKVNTDLTAEVESLKEQAETVILETTRVKEATETATDNADEATKAAIAATELVASAIIDAKAATKLAADASVLAEQKAGLANTAAGVAGTAAGKADTATEKADTATTNAENAAIRLDSLSDHRDVIRDGYWWHWNETTKEYEKTDHRADGNTLFASFDVDPVTGELSVTTPDGYDGPLFELDSNGYLSVIV